MSSLTPCCGITYRRLGARTTPPLSVRNWFHKMSLSLTPDNLGYRVYGHGPRNLGGLSAVQSPLPRPFRPVLDFLWVAADPLTHRGLSGRGTWCAQNGWRESSKPGENRALFPALTSPRVRHTGHLLDQPRPGWKGAILSVGGYSQQSCPYLLGPRSDTLLGPPLTLLVPQASPL